MPFGRACTAAIAARSETKRMTVGVFTAVHVQLLHSLRLRYPPMLT